MKCDSISEVTLQSLQAAFREELPGPSAQCRMGITGRLRQGNLPHEAPRLSAVLLLIYPLDGQLVLPLTLRAEALANHRGQISLPGGQVEDSDASLWAAAVREVQEEIGVPQQQVAYVGALTPYYIATSNYLVSPFVGWADESLALSPNIVEVAEVINLPLAALVHPQTKSTARRELDGREVLVPCYRYRGHIIWGATAMILSELEAILTRATC